MSNFIKSSNCPIFANFLAEDGAVSTGNGFFAATNVSFSLDSSLEPNRVFGGSRISNDFNHSQGQVGKLTYDFYPLVGTNSAQSSPNQYAILNLSGDFLSGHRIKFGNFDLRKCYLSNLDVRISPQSPISFGASFDVYDLSQISGITFTGANISNLLTTNGSGAYLESLHALALGVSGSGVSLPQSKEEINISVQCSRTPVYGLGSIYPSTVILDSLTRQTLLRGENVGNFIDMRGQNAYIRLGFSPFSAFITGTQPFNGINSSLFSIEIDGKVTSQSLNVSENGLIEGSVSVLENLF